MDQLLTHAFSFSNKTSVDAGQANKESSSPFATNPARTCHTPEIRLIALDMDGTLLNSTSSILPSSVAAIRAALDRGVSVILATGKARPAAMTAMQAVGLCGDGLVVGSNGPGIFLQGLSVHGRQGRRIGGGSLPPNVVRRAFEFAQSNDVSICGFLGEECVTTCMTPKIEALHYTFYEPLAAVVPSVDAVLSGQPLRKLLFMASPERVRDELIPLWKEILRESGAECMQAVPEMLEIVPTGWDKWVGMQLLLAHYGLPREAVMAVGDGGNDLSLVRGVGLGVAMGNAVPDVKAVAAAVVATNDEGGVAEAIERYILF